MSGVRFTPRVPALLDPALLVDKNKVNMQETALRGRQAMSVHSPALTL